MALRVPKAELPSGLRESMIKQFGVVPEPVEMMWQRRSGRELLSAGSVDVVGQPAIWL